MVEKLAGNQKVKIAVDDILEKYECPICMCKLNEPLIAKCGHTFCKNCISECVNRQHECPECRAKLTQNDLFRNYSLETLLQKLQEERDRESAAYFNNLASNAVNQQQVLQNNNGIAPNQQQHDRSPIETVFTLNLRESLLAFQEYLEDLNKEKEGLQKKVKTTLSQEILQAKQAGDADALAQVEKQMDQAIQDIERKFSGAIDQLVVSYDEHMKKIMPKPKLLPIRVNITIESKPGIKLENAHIKPYDNCNDIFKLIEEYQLARGDPILSWNKDNLKFLLTGPLYDPAHHKHSSSSMTAGAGMIDTEMKSEQEDESAQASLTQQTVIMDWGQPFSKFSVAPGSTITLMGDGVVQFNSDKPLECMTLSYDKDPTATFNYFSCKTCNINWVCENCKDGCHMGHQLLPHLMNHRPTWACCYCMKQNLCKIANKKRPKV